MGEVAALLTSVCWAFTAILFSRAGKAIGSVKLNRLRLLFAVLLLATTHLLIYGSPVPLAAGSERWLWLGLSGIVGLVIGDAFLLQAYVLVGARIGTLIMAVVPVISALLAWLFLDERLSATEIAGILVAVSGVGLVVLERGAPDQPRGERRQYILGVLCGFGGALGQAGGLILAKRGLEGGFPAISGVVIRMVTAAAIIWLQALVARGVKPTLAVLQQDRKVGGTILLAAILGPFLGVWLSLVAVQSSYVGIASTLMALTPIIVLPFSHFIGKERITPRAVLGTVVAILGVMMIFLLN